MKTLSAFTRACLIVISIGSVSTVHADQSSASVFEFREATSAPASSADELASLSTEFVSDYEQLMAEVFRQISDVYAAVHVVPEADRKLDRTYDLTVAMDPLNLHNRIERFCNPEFNGDQIVSLNCGLSYQFEYLYSHPDYNDVVVGVVNYSITTGITGGDSAGSRISFSQRNGETEHSNDRVLIEGSKHSDGYVVWLQPPDMQCQFRTIDPLTLWTDSSFEGVSDIDVCSLTMRESLALIKRLL